ncbi:MAG: TerC/Alx family metal homeostasis membrane protein [Gaiellales bacterium]
MEVSLWAWALLGAAIVAMLAVDLAVAGRGRQTFARAVRWSVGWTVAGLGFAAVLALWRGTGPAGEYLAGFLVEKSLSLDNLFVFALIFSFLAIPADRQRRVLVYGIVGAIVLRGALILVGAALLDSFHWILYVFGGFLVLTGIRMVLHRESEADLAHNPMMRLLARVVPTSTRFEGDRLFVWIDGRRVATPLLAALALVAAFDVVFAVDSIPAIFAITDDAFVVFAANAFSLLGLTSLFFVLQGMAARFAYLKLGLAAVLVLIGLKLLAVDVVKVPVWASLAAIVAVLGGSIAFSLVRSGGGSDTLTPGGLNHESTRRDT